MIISVYSPNDGYDGNFLTNYCGINIRDQILRVPEYRPGRSLRRN